MAYPVNSSQVEAGDTIALTCVAYGKPLPQIDWYRNNGDLIGDSRVDVSEALVIKDTIAFIRSTLQICNTEVLDSDQYTCVASSAGTNDSFSFELTVMTMEGGKDRVNNN